MTSGILTFGLFLASIGTATCDMKNVTDQVFGTDLHKLPVAFGDFNGDRITDLFVLDQEKRKIAVLLAKEDTFSITSNQYFIQSEKKIECFINDAVIQAVIPGDFDGDGGMDALVVIKSTDDEEDASSGDLVAFVLWGDHNVKTGKHRLVCPGKKQGWFHYLRMTVQPLMVDANADYTADLFGARKSNDSQEERGVWLFNPNNRDLEPRFVPLQTPPQSKIKQVHSNAYLDLNGDGNADIFVTAENRFEIWLNREYPSNVYAHEQNLFLDDCEDNSCVVGQVSFADIDLNGDIDALVPVCYDGPACANSTLLASPISKLLTAERPFKPLNLLLGNWKFGMREKNDGLYSPLTLRIGDINLDGYPDFLVRLRQPLLPNLEHQTHLFLNVEWQDDDTIPKPPKGTRGFILQESVMRNIKDSEMATFFDWHENGVQDMIAVQNRNGKFEIGAFTNSSLTSDAYFVKVIVLSGVCYETCPGGLIRVPYGTNMPGQTVCYQTERVGLAWEGGYGTIKTCAVQLSQSAHSPLTLPYNIFGLGMSPNFLEKMYVNVTNATSHSYGRQWTQIIPNSQMLVVPHPPTDVKSWQLKLYVTPGKGILYTALTLLGTCALIGLTIIFLHWRERVQDRKEKLQEANRFHFDAM